MDLKDQRPRLDRLDQKDHLDLEGPKVPKHLWILGGHWVQRDPLPQMDLRPRMDRLDQKDQMGLLGPKVLKHLWILGARWVQMDQLLQLNPVGRRHQRLLCLLVHLDLGLHSDLQHLEDQMALPRH